ncbi:MAG: efflux RND transporter periplasmic adaptor subunit [Velocimicrobium sp.]
MKKKKKIVFVCFVLAILVAIFIFLKKGSAKNNTQEAYTTEAVTSGDIKEIITTMGKVEALNSYFVWPLSGIEGNIVYSDFEVGDIVKKGQVLYRISTDNLDNKIKTAKENLKQKKRTYRRIKETTKTALEKYSKLSVISEANGYIKDIKIKEGDNITEGSTVIGTLYNNKRMELVVPFSDAVVSSKLIGKKASVILSYSGDKLKGKVVKINDYTEKMSQNRVVRSVTIEVNNPGAINANDRASAKIGDFYGSDEGIFSPLYESTVIATVSGVVNTISVKDGSWVKKGHTIVSIKNDSFKTSINESKEQLESAETAVKDAETDLKSLKKNKKEYEIVSPIAGKVVKKNVKQGDILNATTSKDALCLIYDLSAMNFSMMIDETDVQKLREGQTISITADALPNDSYVGTITSISIEATTSTGGVTQYPVTAQIKKYGKMLPGMNVSGQVVVKEATNVIIIPSNALIRGSFVYVADDKAKEEIDTPKGFRKQEVLVGISDGKNVEIKSGLSEKDMIYVLKESEDLESGQESEEKSEEGMAYGM